MRGRKLRHSCRESRRNGFTLAEALLAATVLAIVAASATLPFTAGAQQVMSAGRLERATTYGESLLEEVLSRPFFGPDGRSSAIGPDAGETSRSLYDDIDDFNGVNENSTGMRTYNDQSITDPDAAGIWRDVQVGYVTFSGQQSGDTNSLATVRVRVFDGTRSSPLVTFYRLVSRDD